MPLDFSDVRGALATEEVRFATLEVRGERARVLPVLDADALYAQLNARFGEAWNLAWHLESGAPAVVRCRLEFLGHAREGLGVAVEVEHARRVALTDAARAWGLLPPHYEGEDTWVEYDPDEGPNTSELLAQGAAPARSMGVPPEPPRDPQLERAKKHIDDLMDQLRESGLGKQASLVLVKHGGYGQSVEESRRVYAELKALQKS